MRFSEAHKFDCISSLNELAINDMVSWRYKELEYHKINVNQLIKT